MQIVGGGKALRYTNPNDGGFPTPHVWSGTSVVLAAANFIDTATEVASTVQEMRAVLKDITQLDICARYVNGAESGGLDNVFLTRAPKGEAGTVPDMRLRSAHWRMA